LIDRRQLAIGTAALVAGWPAIATAQTINFAEAAVGTQPAGFEFSRTGSGPPGRWEVVRDDTAEGKKALAQLSADPTDYRFPLAIYSEVMAVNVEIAARFKPISGKEDQAGGVVVRFSNPNNYYIARANALENNVRFYRVVKGRRQQLASANAKVTAGEWNRLTLRAENDRFTVSLNDKTLHTTTDHTFRSAGKVGLWTKADSVTHFDRVEIRQLP
jgi:hypothetical protein